jgi:hypothetical protein
MMQHEGFKEYNDDKDINTTNTSTLLSLEQKI